MIRTFLLISLVMTNSLSACEEKAPPQPTGTVTNVVTETVGNFDRERDKVTVKYPDGEFDYRTAPGLCEVGDEYPKCAEG